MRIFSRSSRNPDELFAGNTPEPSTFPLRQPSAPSANSPSKWKVVLVAVPVSPTRNGRFAITAVPGSRTYLKQLEAHNDMEAKYSKLWTQCQPLSGRFASRCSLYFGIVPFLYAKKTQRRWLMLPVHLKSITLSNGNVVNKQRKKERMVCSVKFVINSKTIKLDTA